MEYGNREELTVADPEFRRLSEEHRHHEERLELRNFEVVFRSDRSVSIDLFLRFES